MSCLQYYYPTEEETKKFKIKCVEKLYPDLNNPDKFNNKDLLDFIEKNFSTEAFKDQGAELGPFQFSEDYKDRTNEQICSQGLTELAPQQKFMGQLINPLTNFNGVLINHGLGSGKTCTSIVIGEAFKNQMPARLLYVVPAPLVDQYYDEIIGEMRSGKLWSCSSFCIVKNSKDEDQERPGDFYSNSDMQGLLNGKIKELNRKKQRLSDVEKELKKNPNDKVLTKQFSKVQNEIKADTLAIKAYKKTIQSESIKVFDIISHTTFIQQLYKTGFKGQLIKNERLLRREGEEFHGGKLDDAVFSKNGILVIDEIQRLISAGGIFYRKLYNAVKYYFHPELRVVLLSATPIYDNPYELALTINLLRPRIPFPIDKKEFYEFFIGEIVGKSEADARAAGKSDFDIAKINAENERKGIQEKQVCIPSKKSWISDNSCIRNVELIAYLCAGYISYFKGGNPNAYPYKRIITLDHVMEPQQKEEYIQALESDVQKDKGFKEGKSSNDLFFQETILGKLGNTPDKEDSVSGIYVTTQQNSNIALPRISGKINTTIKEKEIAIDLFRRDLYAQKFWEDKEGKSQSERAIEYLKRTGISAKFASIIEESLKSKGPVFIFSNWLIYGVKSLAVILEACGFTEFGSGPGENFRRFFVWSSETKTRDGGEELIRIAKAKYNSVENKDGSILKIILGTRSVMEGVSFKNVRQVHLTEPWWNESRIEQISARGARFCSHSNLEFKEQYIDIFRHYSVLPGDNDENINDMLKKHGRSGFQNFQDITIEQKMVKSAIRKQDINERFNIILKRVAIDVNLNKNGNLVRLEENIIPLSTGKMQIFFRNPSSGYRYIREGIPIEGITMAQVFAREYSFPNDSKLPVVFYLAEQQENEHFTRIEGSEPLTEPEINKFLIIPEVIKPWYSDKTFKDLETPENKVAFEYLDKLRKNYDLLPSLRQQYLQEEQVAVGDFEKSIFLDDPRNKDRLLRCIKKLSEEGHVNLNIQKKIAKDFKEPKELDMLQNYLYQIITVYKLYEEEYYDDLFELGVRDPSALKQLVDEQEALKKDKDSKAKASKKDITAGAVAKFVPATGIKPGKKK